MDKDIHSPWHWTDQYLDSRNEKTMTLVGADGYGILSCDGMINSPQGLGDHRIASLIKAAPDILAALARIAEHTDPDAEEENYRADDREGCLDAVYAIAKAAIAQTEGGAK
jgi:hypothetical protein